MQSHVPRRLTGAALLLTLLLTFLAAAAPATAMEPLGVEAPRIEQVAASHDDEAETGWIAWIVDTWNDLWVVLPSGVRGGGEGSDGGDRNSGMDPNGHDHKALHR